MLCEKFNLQNEFLEKYEADSLATYNENAYRFELSYILQKCEEATLCDDHRKMIIDYMNFASQDVDILKFMWLYYYIQFETEECFMDNLYDQLLPIPLPACCEDNYPGMLKTVVYLLASDHFKRFIQTNNLPENFIEKYYAKYRGTCASNIRYANTYGLCNLSQFVYTYAYPLNINIGRLTYQLLSFKDYCELYEDEDGKRFFLALPNYTYDETGHQNVDATFVPVYEKQGNILTAHTFDELGLLVKEPAQYDLTKIQKLLGPEDKVITIHIPGGTKLTPESVDQSIAEADAFFSKCFAKFHFKAIVCQTWFLDTQLREILSDDSNMIKFQKRFDLVMAGDNRLHSLFEHIFGVNKTELENLVPKNSFQQKMLNRAKEGKKMYWAFGVLKDQVIYER